MCARSRDKSQVMQPAQLWRGARNINLEYNGLFCVMDEETIESIIAGGACLI
jgi:hypothetical protein